MTEDDPAVTAPDQPQPSAGPRSYEFDYEGERLRVVIADDQTGGIEVMKGTDRMGVARWHCAELKEGWRAHDIAVLVALAVESQRGES